MREIYLHYLNKTPHISWYWDYEKDELLTPDKLPEKSVFEKFNNLSEENLKALVKSDKSRIIQRNDLGYAVVKKIENIPQEKLDKIAKNLARFDIKTPIDYPEEVPFVPQFKLDYLPKQFKNYNELFENFAEIACGEEVKLVESLLLSFETDGVPKPPNSYDIARLPGWSKYDFDGNYICQVDYPDEEVCIFDTETFVEGGNFPIIGAITAAKYSYIWTAREFFDTEIEYEDYDQLRLVPLPKTKVIIGHNVGFDLCRVSDAYQLPAKITAMDTLSMHIACNGLSSGQRYIASLYFKPKESLTYKEKAILRNPPKWVDAGTTNSLLACYNFHVAKNDWFEETEQLTDADKKIRDVFVKTPTMKDFAQFPIPFQQDLLHYAIKDTFYTAQLFTKLYPKYKRTKPHKVAIAGHLALYKGRATLVKNWKEWIQSVETQFENYQQRVSDLVKEQADFLYEQWKNGELTEEEISNDPFYSQLDWTTVKKQKKYILPKWYAGLFMKPDQLITTKSDLCHLLMRLHWKGKPLYKVKNKGWGTYDESGNFNKVPHKESVNENVGNMLAKNFLDDIKLGNLTGQHPNVEEVFNIATRTSFWVSTRSRVLERFYLDAKVGKNSNALIMVPQPIVHGTTTGRQTENLFLVMSGIKKYKLGSELKSRVQAPPGYVIVSSDFSAQEMQLSGLLADRYAGGYLGCTPTTFQNVVGRKDRFQDPHSAVAYELFLKPKGYKLINGEWFIEEDE